MTDPEAVREQLRRLARGETVPARDRERVIERAAAASCDVGEAAVFVAGGGRERLAGAVEADEREGNEARATRGRAVLARYEAFAAACDPPPGEGCQGEQRRDERRPADGRIEDGRTDDGPTDDRAEPLPPRSRNE